MGPLARLRAWLRRRAAPPPPASPYRRFYTADRTPAELVRAARRRERGGK